jgi:hypothetical protein
MGVPKLVKNRFYSLLAFAFVFRFHTESKLLKPTRTQEAELTAFFAILAKLLRG